MSHGKATCWRFQHVDSGKSGAVSEFERENFPFRTSLSVTRRETSQTDRREIGGFRTG